MKESKDLREQIKETLKQAEEEEKRLNDELVSEEIKITSKSIELLSSENEKNFKAIEDLTKKIVRINNQMLKAILNEDDFKAYKKNDKIEFTLNKKLDEDQKSMIKSLNGRFITEKILLIVPYILEGIKQSELSSFEEDFSKIQELSNKKRRLLSKFYKLYDTISDTNREIHKIIESFIDDLPKNEVEGNPTIDLTSENNLNEFMYLSNKAFTIDEMKMFEISRKAESEYKITLTYDEETEKVYFKINKDLNFGNEYLDINQKLQDDLLKAQEKIEELSKEPEELKNFQPIPIEKQIAFNDKLSHNLHNLTNNTSVELVNTGGQKKKYKNEVMKAIVENGEMKSSKVLEPFDKVLLDSIYSLIQKNQYFDIQMLKEEMTGNTNRHKGLLDEDIKKAIDKLRTTFITIEIPDSLQETMKSRFDKIGIRETILPLREFYVVKGGHKKQVYGFNSKSIYYEYEEARGQLITKDKKLLQGGIGNATKQSIVLTDYLSNRIEDMKHQKEKNHSDNYIQEITLETIWSLILTDDDLQMKPDSLQKKKKRYQEQIKTILTTYKNDRYIKDFENYSNGFKIKL